jgi:hypothetical protein
LDMAWGGLALVLNQWEAIGVFDFLLPFLFIFSVVYGILTFTKIFGENRGIHVVLAVVVGLMALQWQGFILFTKEVFPKLGIGLSLIFVAFLLISLFVAENERRYWGWGLAVLGIISFLIIGYTSFENLGMIGYGGFISDNIGYVIGAILLVGLIIAVISNKDSGSSTKEPAVFSPWFPPVQAARHH